jgi:hypothetical protein
MNLKMSFTVFSVGRKKLYPVLATCLLEKQIRQVVSNLHVCGHSHVNSIIMTDEILYINNTSEHPNEDNISEKILKCIFEF